jgi:hypothetical protein
VMAWALLCPATNPTTRSLAAVVVTEPELAAAPVLATPVDTSRGLVVATPLNSWTSKLTEATEALWTVTVVTGLALAEYHISPSEKWPATKWVVPMRVQVFPAESVTDVIGLVDPVYTLAESTSRWPAVVGTENEPEIAVEEVVSVPLALWTSCGAAPVGEVTVRPKVVEWVAEAPVPVTVTV